MKSTLHLSLPDFLLKRADGFVATHPEARMREVISWSRENITAGEGPFAAGVFDLDTGACVGAGVNRVVASNCSPAHAEMMALMFAQQQLGTHDLSTRGRFVLTSSAQPCSQCFGALPWSGIRRLEFGADREEVESIGFDEGPFSPNWRDQLASRNIEVHGPLLGDEAAEVLRDYRHAGGPLY